MNRTRTMFDPALWVRPDDTIPGTPGDDTLIGTAGDDTLDGGAGADLMRGRNGNDLYVVDNLGDQVFESQAGGIDTVLASVDFVLGNQVENLTLTGTGKLNGTGNTLDNLMTGHSGASRLYGGNGQDTLLGHAGNDSLVGGQGDDSIDGGLGTNQLFGEAGNDWLVAGGKESRVDGGSGDDVLIGSDLGTWVLDGGSGRDQVTGGSGREHVHDSDLEADTLEGGAGIDFLEADWSALTTDLVMVFDSSVTQVINGNTISGIEHTDVIAGSGNDVLRNDNGGWSTFSGGAGNDRLSGGKGQGVDNLYGDGDNDTLIGGSAGWTMHDGGRGSDLLVGGRDRDIFVFDTLDGSDTVSGYRAINDDLIFRSNRIPIGDRDNRFDGATTIEGPGGFWVGSELVIVTGNIAGDLTAAAASAAIGSAKTAYGTGRTALFVVDNGTDSAIYYFKSSGADAVVSAAELTLMVTLEGIENIDDYEFGLAN